MHDTSNNIFTNPITPGILLLLSGLIAMLLSNSAFAPHYFSFVSTTKPVNVIFFVNDLLMAIFFLEVGLEIKNQASAGHLTSLKQVLLPTFAAVGGVLCPAIIFCLFNYENIGALQGWAIPTATDIAFALGVILLLGNRIPIQLRIILLTIAVIDDLIAILIIAFFYSHAISWLFIMLSLVVFVALLLFNFLNIKKIFAYLSLGIALWFCMLNSGLHATLSGVIVALTIPASTRENLHTPLKLLVAFIILPLFAFVNAGISLQDINMKDIFEPVPIGIALGLIFGKQIGVFSFSWLSVKTNMAVLPAHVKWSHLYGMAVLCGIGFTMSIFIANLAYAKTHIMYLELSKLGVLGGSCIAGILGFTYLWFKTRQKG